MGGSLGVMMEEMGLGKGRVRGAQPQGCGFPLLTSLSPQTGIPKRGSFINTPAQGHKEPC